MESPDLGAGAQPSEDALEAALRCLIAQSQATAGALCLLDDRIGGLRLVVDVGLSDDGCESLRALGRPDGESWSLPLESLLARQPRVAPGSDASPVPPLLDPPTAPATVLCLPLLAGDVPLGTVVLVARPPVMLRAADGAALEPGLARLAHAVERLLREIPEAARPSLLGRLASQPLDAAVPLLDQAADLIAAARGRPRPPTQEAAALRDALRSERNHLLAERATTAATHAAERARLAAHLDETEARWSRSVRLAEEHVQHEMQAQLDAHLARSAADREETLRHARELVQRSEQQRAAAAAEAAEAVSALAEARAQSMALEGNVALLEERANRLEAAAEAAAADRSCLERSLAESREAAVRAREEAEAQQADARRREAALALTMASSEQAAAARIADLSAALDDAVRRRDALTAVRDSARSEIRCLQEDHDAFKARAASDREETLRAALAANEATEAARAAAVAELDVVLAALGKSQGLLLDLEDERANRAEIESARSAMALSEGARLAAEDQARALEAEIERLTAVQRDLQPLADEAVAARAAAAEAVACAEARGRDLLRAEAAAERAEAAARAEGEVAARAEARARDIEALLGETRAQATALESRLHDALAALEQVRARERQRAEDLRAAERVATDHEITLRRALALSQASEEARAAAVDETEALRGALASAQGKLLAAEDEARHVHEEAERLRLGARRTADERERLVVAADEAIGRVATLAARVAELEAERAAERTRKSGGRSTAVAGLVPGTPRPPKGREGVLVVLDGTAAWAGESGTSSGIVSMSPGDVNLARLGSAAGVVVNLGAPGVFNAIAAARQAGHTMRLWGCVTLGATGPALVIGAVEVLESPLDPARAVAALRPHLDSARRVLAVGGDGPGLLALRQALNRLRGTSVSIAWDAKQAIDLLQVVRPEIVVVDLALRGAHALVTEVAAAESEPVIALIPAGGDESVFATVAAPLLSGRRALPRDAIVARALAAIRRETSSKIGLLERARDLR